MIEIKNALFYCKKFIFNLNCIINKKEKIAILGHSGSGKSTLLNLLAGFIFLKKGEIWLDGSNHTNTLPCERPVSILFQENNLFPHLTVLENISLGISPNLQLNNFQTVLVHKIMKEMFLEKYMHYLPSQISGGQCQLTSLARCLIRQEPILLLDEPFASLDPVLYKDILKFVNDICDRNSLTLLLVSHNLKYISKIVSRVIVIHHGVIIYDDKIEHLLNGSSSVSHLFDISNNDIFIK
uniref:Thiamine ABC transporter ATP-binding protein ThiQ n=1 Tax=Candidatus Aschnera chinzeii TaxID=1485666 RepID=A0AAT9G4P4_9ENTR|nr:MAG: thiamine ABC transporter ATP-binding protein ThiQ [Candidatus Aschnera chinzeii]